MVSKYDPAFPHQITRDEKADILPESYPGMSKREMYALMSKPSEAKIPIEYAEQIVGSPYTEDPMGQIYFKIALEQRLRLMNADALINAMSSPDPFMVLPSNLNPENWWTDRNGEIHCDPIGNMKIGRLYMMKNGDDVQARGERIIACVKAMEGINSPETWREQLIEHIRKEMPGISRRGGQAFNAGIEECIHIIENFGKK